MEHYFNLPIVVNEVEHQLFGRLVTFGYARKFYVMFGKIEIAFEHDQQMNLNNVTATKAVNSISADMINCIAAALQKYSNNIAI